nr:hypothetical protein [Tanacetum cinerariifolium]
MRINPGIKPKELTFQVVLDALALTTCYPTFLITAEVPVIYMHQFWDTINKHKASYRFNIDNKWFSVNVVMFEEILNMCPMISGQEFDKPLTEEEALSFIREIGHSREIKYITDDLAYQIDNKDTKKQDKKFYPRFMKIIIHHFLEKDKSISMRNRTFMHTARDDNILGTMRFVSRHEDTQKPTKAKKYVPSKKKPASKPNPTKKKASVKADRGKGFNVVLEVALSEAAQLKEATKRSKKEFHISQASGSGDRTDFESGVTNEQLRNTSSADEGTSTKAGVLDVPKYDLESDKESWGDSGEEDDDDDEDDTEDYEGNDDGDDSDGNDDDNNDHERTKSNRDRNLNLNQFNEEHEEEEEKENVDEFTDKEDEEGNKEESNDREELYKDVNVNLRKEDVEMIDVDQGGLDQHNVSQESGFKQEEEDAHVTLTIVHDTQKTESPMQSSSVSSNFTEKLLKFKNISPDDNEIASLMDTIVRTKEPNVFTLKRNRDKKDKDQDPSAGSDRGMNKRKYSKEAESQKYPRSKEGRSSSSSKDTSRSHHKSSSKSVYAEEPSHTVNDSIVQKNQEFDMSNNDEQPEDEVSPKNDWFKKPERPPTTDPDWNKRQHATTERLDWHNPKGKPYLFDLQKPLSLIPDHKGHQVIPQDYFINNDLEYLKGGSLSRQYSTSVTKTKSATYEIKWIEDLFSNLWSPVKICKQQGVNEGCLLQKRIIAVTRLKIIKKYDYGHLDENEVRREDQRLYAFKEGDFPRLHLQDIEDMLCLLGQHKLTNLTIDEHYDLNVALRMFTIRIVIKRRVEDLQLGVKSYQKKLNLTKPYAFSDGTLNDVWTALHDITLRIRMKYLPKKKWSGLDKRRARVMIHNIDKLLYKRMLMRNLKKFVCRREYENGLRLLERTI